MQFHRTVRDHTMVFLDGAILPNLTYDLLVVTLTITSMREFLHSH